MPSNTQNVKLGVCTVIYDGVDLGYTQGGVEVTVESTTKKVMVDQFGNSEINEFILSRSCKAKVPLAETTMENLVRIMPGATMNQVGGAKATGTVTFVTSAPVNNDAIVLNGVTYTYKTAPVAGTNDQAIPATIAAAATALAALINNSTDPAVAQITASAAAGVVTLTADDFGVLGNLFTLAKVGGTNITLSGATMTGGVDPTKKNVSVTNAIGTSLLARAKKLILHPIANDANNKVDDFVIPLASTAGQMSFSFKLDQERLFPVEFVAYPDPVSKRLFIVGDETAG